MLNYSFHMLTLWPLWPTAIIIEIAFYRVVAKRAYPWAETATSLAIFALRLLGKGLRAAVFLPVIAFLWRHRIATIPLDAWRAWVLLFFAEAIARRLKSAIRWGDEGRRLPRIDC